MRFEAIPFGIYGPGRVASPVMALPFTAPFLRIGVTRLNWPDLKRGWWASLKTHARLALRYPRFMLRGRLLRQEVVQVRTEYSVDDGLTWMAWWCFGAEGGNYRPRDLEHMVTSVAPHQPLPRDSDHQTWFRVEVDPLVPLATSVRVETFDRPVPVEVPWQ